MTKADIFSGFLGAGKTTLINRLVREAFKGEQLVLIENEFGQIGIDSGFLKDSGIEITEMNSGCICCSLVGDFSKALAEVISTYSPDRILIEPSGVGKLSDVTKAVLSAEFDGARLNSSTAVVDVNKCKMYMKNFGEFFNDQIGNAGCIIFSHTDNTTQKKLTEAIALVREKNPKATLVTTPIADLGIETLVDAIECSSGADIEKGLFDDECPVCHHHHEHEHCHHGEDHHHGEEHHHSHEHHHADEVFSSWGMETVGKYSPDMIRECLDQFEEMDSFGVILRAKGIVQAVDGSWIHFDYVPGDIDVRSGSPSAIGKICVIGSNINEEEISKLFEIL